MSFALSPNATSPDAHRVSDVIAKLRAECDATDAEARRALLLHEIGVLEDRSGNEGQAARDLLSAVNALPDFHEPLERLVVLIERRKSYKNLGKLVDRLVKIAETPEELARALVTLAEFRQDHEGDPAGAREALERATQTKSDDVDAWLFLERLCAELGDSAMRRRALAARADLATDPAWRALLFLDVARLHAESGEIETAIAALERTLEGKTEATFSALLELERIGRTSGREDLVLRALESQADLVSRAVDAKEGDKEAEGVPLHRRTAAHAAEARLRAAEIHRRRGDTDKATALFERVVADLPDDSAAAGARLRAAELAGDTMTAAAMARTEIDRGARGAVAASLFMRVAEAAASTGDATAALGALRSALAEDPKCIPARSLELDLLSGGGDANALAQALEAAATELGDGDLAVNLFLLAADTWTRGANDIPAAKAALSQAAAAGGSPEVVARTARTLSAFAGGSAWFEESTRRLIATNPPESERASLWFELGRAKLLRHDIAGAVDAFESLSGVPGGAFLGQVLKAYALPRSAPKPEQGDEAGGVAAPRIEPAREAAALEALSDIAADPAASQAFQIAAALRYQLSGMLDESILDLSALHESTPSDLVIATALATLLRRQGDASRAADALAATAKESENSEIASALEIESGIVRWLAGDRAGAIAMFDAASKRAPEAASGLYAWALRAAEPNDVASRRAALDAAGEGESSAALAVERYGLEVGAGGTHAEALRAVENASDDGPFGVALDLARSLLSAGDPAAREFALGALAVKSPEASAIARASSHFGKLFATGEKDAQAAEASAAKWADADPSVAAALEWIGQAVGARDPNREVQARRHLAQRLGGAVGVAIESSGRIVARIANDDVSSPLLEGAAPEQSLTNLELAPPSCDPRRRASALLGGVPVMDDTSGACAVALAGWNLLAAGDAPSAVRAFRTYLSAHAEDIVGWEGLRAAAELSGDRSMLAEASAALGDLSSDAGQGAELWERAALVLLDELDDPARGEAALSKAVHRDITRFTSFDRLFRIVRARQDGPRLLELISSRLAVADTPAEIAKLYWERARVLRQANDSKGALEALENVTMLEADHVGALALTGEIYISEKRFAEAAQNLARLASLSNAPAQQRLMSGIAAVDLYENRLSEFDKALEVLVGLHRAGLATLPVRERLARAAARTESWETAVEVLEELMAQRESSEGRIEAARFALALYRDRIRVPARAFSAVERLLQESPADGEALDFVLSGALKNPLAKDLLRRGRAATIAELEKSPLDLERMQRLAELAKRIDDPQLRQVALGAVVALGGGNSKILSELSELDARIARVPQIAVDDAVIARLKDPEDRGPIAELMRALAPTLTEALGPGLAALGVGKKERVRPQDGLPVRNEIAAWVGALGLGEFEFYVGGRDDEGVYALPTEVPTIVVGANVNSPLSAVHRQALARELIALKLGTTIVRHRDAADVAALVVAACNLAQVPVDSPPYAMVAEFARQIGKEIPRRVRKMLPELTRPIAETRADPIAWVRAAKSTVDRMAAIAIGDVSWVLSTSESGRRGEAPVTAEGKLRAGRLLAFVLSDTFFSVRERLGMGVR